MTCKEAAAKWGMSARRVSELCAEGRVEGATMFGNAWAIDKNASKPDDVRIRNDFFTKGTVKPVIKWAGGKGQLLEDIRASYPDGLGDSITSYVEPFIGGAAVLFDILNTYKMERVYLSDINRELINLYITIRDNPEDLIDLLSSYQEEHLSKDANSRKDYFNEQRAEYNRIKKQDDSDIDWVKCSSLFIYLNKTCFNGLYRVNAKGDFNVPSGVYKNPTICDSKNIQGASKLLQGAIIHHGSYLDSTEYIDERTLVYFDPPYRPLSTTASFTSYTKDQFNDDDQIELSKYVRKLIRENQAKVMVSNSDPKNTNPDDDFFDDLYAGLNIQRIQANRAINSKGTGRGKINELLITSYDVISTEPVIRSEQVTFDYITE